MKKTLKKIMAGLSAISVLATALVFPMGASAYHDSVYYENNIKDIEISSGVYPNEYTTFKDGQRISVFTTRAYRMNYVVDSSVKDVTSKYLGISDNFAIRKIDMGETNLYSVAVDTREEMAELFNSASALYKNGKIKDAYSLMNIGWSPMEYYEEEGAWVTIEIACGGKMAKYLNNEPKIIVEGDVNSDNEINVRDCADLAYHISQNKSDEISAIADFNIDGKINVRDAAAIANFLVWHW